MAVVLDVDSLVEVAAIGILVNALLEALGGVLAGAGVLG